MRRIFPRRPYLNIVGHKYIWFSISAAIVVVAAVALFTIGLNFGIDFTGGTEMDIKCKPGTSISQVRDVLGKFGYGNAQIQSAGDNRFIVRTPKLDDAKKKEVTAAFKEGAGLEEVLGVNDVGPGWGAQVSRQALIAFIVFIFAILIYISIRFEFKMAICAIVELFHDFVITVGVYALFGLQVTPATVVAFLTILGYSLYDTIVIFDRIKENTDQLTRQSKKTYSEVANDSVNQVFTRSINTSLTTLIPIVTILIFGGETLKAFAFVLFVGVLSGTYSSIILAPPVLSLWKETEPKYRAYRERAERAQAREGKVQVEPVAAGPAAVGSLPETESKQSAKVPAKGAVKKPARTTAKVKKESAAAKPAVKPQPKPKPAGKAAAVPGKGAAQARSKGPGSGKRKKKKKKK
ncbi:MAG: protein translocase subunit SecF [Actinobacteria bacterium]|nr:protein translocase subunit SecF [Actinomycetota bacterium]